MVVVVNLANSNRPRWSAKTAFLLVASWLPCACRGGCLQTRRAEPEVFRPPRAFYTSIYVTTLNTGPNKETWKVGPL